MTAKTDYPMHRMTLTLLALTAAPALGATQTSVDAETGLATWQVESQGIQVRLTQISPDQVRAFYQARGFAPAAAERYASQCVFMTVVRNVGNAPLAYRLTDWRYRTERTAPQAIRGKDGWDRIWAQLGVSDAARIAFNWAQIPAAQTYAPGDWNQGMTAYSVPHGARFDLDFSWRAGRQTLTGTLENVRCADAHS